MAYASLLQSCCDWKRISIVILAFVMAGLPYVRDEDGTARGHL